MASVIQVSFKEKEKELYNYVSSKSDISAYIKDCIKFFIKNSSNSTFAENITLSPVEPEEIDENVTITIKPPVSAGRSFKNLLNIQ